MKNQSDALRKILQISSILIAVGLLGCCIVLNVESLRTAFFAGLFAFIACAGCVGMIVQHGACARVARKVAIMLA